MRGSTISTAEHYALQVGIAHLPCGLSFLSLTAVCEGVERPRQAISCQRSAISKNGEPIAEG